MNKHENVLLVSAPNLRGEQFVRALLHRHIPFAAIVNNEQEYERLLGLGVETIIAVDTSDEGVWSAAPDIGIGRVYLFERSLNQICRYLLICRKWSNNPIYVITEQVRPKLMYRGLGANYVIYASGQDSNFLITDEMTDQEPMGEDDTK
ncbi:hypothetical protein [Paenibacillus agaridevorans]|uniref:hypothetical protein n=1 Tax=Paenibacillus agaridevorans TaxID=171404 RepID=UPI001BE3EC23|nr:hypothetical protein [Paenibacillus agaridevorans]